MNNPFYYHPHPLCVKAAHALMAYVRQHTEWTEEVNKGKMFGVLVVKHPDGTTSVLNAFSGILCGSNTHEGFVPPVYNLQNPDGYFAKEQDNISAINTRIYTLEHTQEYLQAQASLAEAERNEKETITQAREELQERKRKRTLLRQSSTLTPEEEELLNKESQYWKAEFKRLSARLHTQTEVLRHQIQTLQSPIDTLKEERKQRSCALQQWLFRQFVMLNAKGESKDLWQIFQDEGIDTPPAGSGECCAPKLLQYAYQHNLHPLHMAEFWMGASPKDELREEGEFYPSCISKCKPILRHMLKGLDVDYNPQIQRMRSVADKMRIIYEDQWICAIHKPSGMLTVPGKVEAPSVYDKFLELHPDTEGPIIVHRLDMDTSGLLILAKDKQSHKRLQRQFASHTVRKRYIALLEGNVPSDSGTIDLPLSPSYNDRPRQRVDHVDGKSAITHYEVLRRNETVTTQDNTTSTLTTRIAFYPQTGRTHQLRVHAAHPEGLHCPILGDPLYGHKSDRLYLHAESVEFIHPATGERLSLSSECDF